MKSLIIAEKPSLAKTICNAIPERFENKDGYFESNSYIVSFAFGHLFTLYDIEDYTGEMDKKWADTPLPYIPEVYQYKLKQDFSTKKTDAGVKKQYKILENLIHDTRVSRIINAGDADREGEIIVRIILKESKNNKPVFRLWLKDQTEESIQNGLDNLIVSSKYDALALEGYTRAFMDWLYGINLTRYATNKSNTLLRVGRVITAIVKAIYDRDMEIKNFKPKPYLILVSREETSGEIVELKVKREFETVDRMDAEKYATKLNGLDAIVSDIQSKEKIISPPKLFSQSTLQNHLSEKFNFAPEKTLSLVQALYEKGLVSYPRTPTEYMATNEKGKVKDIIESINNKGKIPLKFKDNKRIFDDSKIESHSAITPTTKIADSKSFSNEDERNCYEAIYRRFCAVFFSQDCIENESIMKISCGDEIFEIKGNVSIQKGWKSIEVQNTKDRELPNLVKGQKVAHVFKTIEEQTKPKKHYTVTTLNNFLKNPFRSEIKDIQDEDDSKEYEALLKGLEIGTEATRSGIIKSAIQSKYVSLNKSTYKILDKGIYLVETLGLLGIDLSKEKTTFFGAELKKVYLGEKKPIETLNLVKNELESIIHNSKDIVIEQVIESKTENDEIGRCPICSKNVKETSLSYTCEDRECRFTIWKESNYITKFGKKKLTKTIMKSLLKNGKANIKGLTSKTGKKYDAEILLEISDKYINLKPNFNRK